MRNTPCATWRLPYAAWLSVLIAYDVISLPLGGVRLTRLASIQAWPQEIMATRLQVFERTRLFYGQPLADVIVACIVAPFGFVILFTQLHSYGEEECLGLANKGNHIATVVVPCLCLALALGCMGAGMHCCGMLDGLDRTRGSDAVVVAQPGAELPPRATMRLCMAPFAAPKGEVFMCAICLVTSEDIGLRWGKLRCSHCYHEACIKVSVVALELANAQAPHDERPSWSS